MNKLWELAKVVALKQLRQNRKDHQEGSSVDELCDELDIIAESVIEDILLELESEGKVHSREDCDVGQRWFPGTFEQEEDRREREEEFERMDLL
jgi:hypothetical protein